ncbi:hypothetical protein EfmAA610_11660 [Enterococcus faecium]|nr:hypothetical protein EfmAA610_11660 [Enterococcus faecium]
MKNTRVQKMVAVAMFAAIALVLQYFFPSSHFSLQLLSRVHLPQ